MLIGREEEAKELKAKIEKSLKSSHPLTIYISGATGTGKTATTKAVIKELDKRRNVQTVYINCGLKSEGGKRKKRIDISKAILNELGIFPNRVATINNELIKAFTTSKKKLIIVLDEIDQMSPDNLYQAFRWPAETNGQVILIGIANSLDLTERLLPGLKADKFEPEVFSFPPYKKEQIVDILTNYLSTQSVGNEKAIELCARKVASQNGDIRDAFSIATKALKEMNEEEENENIVAVPPGLVTPKKNNIRTVMRVFNEVKASPLLRASLPEHSRIFLATLLRLVGNSKSKTTTKAKLITAYEKVCRNLKIPAVSGDERIRAIDNLETMSVISCSGTGHQTKIVFIDEITQARAKVADSNLVASVDEMDL